VKIAYQQYLRRAAQIFDLEDEYARERGVRGGHPRPIGRISFYLVGQIVNDTVKEFDEPLELEIQRNPSGYHLFFGMATQGEGAMHSTRLADGRYRLRVESDFYQTVEVSIDIPMLDPKAPVPLDLQPSYAYPLHTHPVSMRPILQGEVSCNESAATGGRGPTVLRGSLFHVDGRGVAGATVQVDEQSNIYNIDTTGQFLLTFPEDQGTGHVTVHFALPDGVTVDVENVCVIRGHATSLNQTSLRGWVLNEAGVGIPEATIRVDGFPGQTTTVTDGSWFYYFRLNQPADLVSTVDLNIALPDGRTLTRREIPIEHRATALVPTIRIS
jgi:hypothetical protein